MQSADLAINGPCRRRQVRLRALASGIDIPVRELYCSNTHPCRQRFPNGYIFIEF
jgi:hypothetical protein